MINSLNTNALRDRRLKGIVHAVLPIVAIAILISTGKGGMSLYALGYWLIPVAIYLFSSAHKKTVAKVAFFNVLGAMFAFALVFIILALS